MNSVDWISESIHFTDDDSRILGYINEIHYVLHYDMLKHIILSITIP